MALVPRLVVDVQGLFFGTPGSLRGARLRFLPESAELHGSGTVRQLPWEKVLDPLDHLADGYSVPYADHWAIARLDQFDGTFVGVGDDRYRVGSSLTGLMIGFNEEAAASSLCAYLRDVHAARPGLAHRDAISILVEQLAHHNWLNRNRTPLAGARLDVSRHLLSALRSLGVHCYLGRLVEGEVAPAVPDVVEVVRSNLPSFVKGKATTAEAVGRRYERLRSARPWPFAVLLG